MPSAPRPSRLRRLLTVTALTFLGLLAGSAPAWAHLEVDPGTAAPEEIATVTFRVPNESATASTTKVEIQIPSSTPLATVRFQQTPGWIAASTITKLTTPVAQGNFTITQAVTAITFAATEGNELRRLQPHPRTAPEHQDAVVPQRADLRQRGGRDLEPTHPGLR